jgi:hypothetical protein
MNCGSEPSLRGRPVFCSTVGELQSRPVVYEDHLPDLPCPPSHAAGELYPIRRTAACSAPQPGDIGRVIFFVIAACSILSLANQPNQPLLP